MGRERRGLARRSGARLLAKCLGTRQQLGWSHRESLGQSRECRDARPALGPLNPTDVVAVDPALKPEALLRHSEFVASGSNRLAEADEEWIALGHDRPRCSPTVLGSTA